MTLVSLKLATIQPQSKALPAEPLCSKNEEVWGAYGFRSASFGATLKFANFSCSVIIVFHKYILFDTLYH